VGDGEFVEVAKRLGLAGQGENIDRGAFAHPVPAGDAGALGEPSRCVGVAPGEPLVEQPERDPCDPGDGSGVVLGGFGRNRVEHGRGGGDVAGGEGFGDLAQRGGGEFAVSAGGENSARFARSTARSMARCRVSMSGRSPTISPSEVVPLVVEVEVAVPHLRPAVG